MADFRIGFVILLAFAIAPSAIAQTSKPIQPDFFGMHVHYLHPGGPRSPFGAFRFWDTGTRWDQIEPTQGMFEFSRFDQWVSLFKNDPDFKGNEAVFTLGPGTPAWASEESDDRKCDFFKEDGVPGQCYPPKDVAKDGSGTDQMWKDFVSAVAEHALQSGIHVKYWEVWNEFNDSPKTQKSDWQWAGTPQQLERMAEDARCVITGRGHVRGVACTAQPIDSSAIILSPSFQALEDAKHLKAAKAYFQQPGAADAAEEIAFHAYTLIPEDESQHIQIIKGTLLPIDKQRPFISTEGGWHQDCQLPDLDVQMSFVARMYFILNTNNVDAFYWYAWQVRDPKTGIGFGSLWNPDANGLCTTPHAGITPAGVARQQTYSWMVGAQVSPCTQDQSVKTVYTCNVSRTGGYLGQAIWDSSKACSQGKCKTRTWPVPKGMLWYRDLSGNTVQIVGSTVQIGIKPILLENMQ